MKTREDILFDVKWPYYALNALVIGLPIAILAFFQFQHFDVFANDPGLFLLPHLVIMAVCYALLKLTILPHYYLWAFSKTDDAKWLQTELMFSLPFYPKRKWYFGLIPFYGKHEAQIVEISAKLWAPSNLQNIDLVAYEVNDPIVPKRDWYGAMLYLLLFFGLTVGIGLTYFFDRGTGHALLVCATFLMFLINFGYGVLRSFKTPRCLMISAEGIKVGAVSHPWSSINTINYYKPASYYETLQIITNEGMEISIPVEHYSVLGTQLHGYALYYQREYLQSVVS